MAASMPSLLLVGILLMLAPKPPTSYAQENVQTRIPNSLTECYTLPDIVNRDTRLPSNINVLIELIRKLEDWPGLNMDMRQVASTLVHRFRMDGIERAPGTFQANVLPYSPSGFQFSKHRVLLSRLIPGSANLFPAGALNAQERCALHFMLSTSIERHARNDEANVCNQLSQLRSMRIPRAFNIPRKRRSVAQDDNFIGDVELLEARNTHKKRSGSRSGRLIMAPLDEDDMFDPTANDEGEPSVGADGEEGLDASQAPIDVTDELDNDGVLRNVEVFAGAEGRSQCPVENGVIRTMWGAVSGGPMITGIAAGLEPQTVQIRDLLALSRSATQFSARQNVETTRVDNRWAATLAGDLAEVTLLQGPMSEQVEVGGIGGWNSTTIPRWYFLSQRDRLEMTDAEIRGGLDGLILATGVESFRRDASQLRLSQLLDMYYSQRGVFSSNTMSCNRGSLFTEVAPIATLRSQTEAFSAVLDREMQMRVTLPAVSIRQFGERSANRLSTYIPQSLNDPSCATTSIVPRDRVVWRAAAELLIYVDLTWTFREIQPVIATLIESLDVSRFGTSFTLMNANDATVLVNTTNSLSDFYTLWNNTNHQAQPNGLVLPNVLRSMRARSREMLAWEQINQSVGGKSLISLIIPQLGAVSEADAVFSQQELILLNEEAPDMLLLFLTGGSTERFSRFVREPSRDLFQLQVTGANTDNIPAFVNPVVQRIYAVPRRVINPRCGANWTSIELGGFTMHQYVERESINFYRLAPNYFFQHAENRRLTIKGLGYGSIVVCTSRTTENPTQALATAENDINCRQLLSNSLEVPIANFCDGHSHIFRCPPLFVSVSSNATSVPSLPYRCNDPLCRFPDNVRFEVTVDNLGCASGVARMAATLSLVMVSLFTIMLRV